MDVIVNVMQFTKILMKLIIYVTIFFYLISKSLYSNIYVLYIYIEEKNNFIDSN